MGIEVLAVLGLSLGIAAVQGVLDLVREVVVALERHQPLSAQRARLYAPFDLHPYIDLGYQLVGVAAQLAPVLLVVYLLLRAGESLVDLGMDWSRPRADLAQGCALAAIVGGIGLGALLAFKAVGLNLTIVIGSTRHYWWTIPLLIVNAAGNAISEEVIICGYLLRRLDQLGWGRRQAVLLSAVLRGGYHLYQGPGQFVSNFVLGLLFGSLFQRTKRVGPLVVAHFLIDAVAFVGYLELHGHVSWLP